MSTSDTKQNPQNTNPQDAVVSSLSTKINEYSQWRETLISTIDEYLYWLSIAESLDAMQELRLYDIKEILKKDQLVMAFLAEFSRGKTETINALFFQISISAYYLANQVAPRCALPRFFGTRAKSHASNFYLLKQDKPTTRLLISKRPQVFGKKFA